MTSLGGQLDRGATLSRPTLAAPARWDGPRLFLAGLGMVLVGYVLLGRGFAGLPLPPLFWGELLLAPAAGVMLTCRQWRWLAVEPVVVLVLVLQGVGLGVTLPYISTHGFDALRDAVLWGYGVYALAVAAALAGRVDLVVWWLWRYRRYGAAVILLGPALFAGQQLLGPAMPEIPGTGQPLIGLKAGDVLVQLGGVTGMAICGVLMLRPWWLYVPLVTGVGLVGIVNRGGLLSVIVAAMLAVATRPRSPAVRTMALTGAVVLALVVAVNPQIDVPNRSRTYSIDQFVANAVSIFDSGEFEGDLDETKAWRLNWWSDIAGYTFGGAYFWTGKGYGVNLADSDGYQVRADGSLRSPHNGHLTILARGGVPMFAVWVAIQGAWLLGCGRAWRRARRDGRPHTAALLAFTAAFWVALSCNASFDVYLENPMGGIWYWTIVGFGVAILSTQRRRPAELEAALAQSSTADAAGAKAG